MSETWFNSPNNMPYDNTGNVRKLAIAEKYKPYRILIPNYCPPFYCKPIDDYPFDVQKHVDDASPENLVVIRKHWRRWQQNKMLENFDFSGDFSGLPMNPAGRQGIAGRGCHIKFGANLRTVYVLLRGTKRKQLQV
ncbi:unnamed protein product [Gongylonema pulchrum]|uniref:SURF1-like protein n=1 Tax=Gongylonema pulchrum TaxID=637853 RepID=A0A183DDU4_9BILA|nr:unnamed protein product [Gongylonema pulchrum]